MHRVIGRVNIDEVDLRPVTQDVKRRRIRAIVHDAGRDVGAERNPPSYEVPACISPMQMPQGNASILRGPQLAPSCQMSVRNMQAED